MLSFRHFSMYGYTVRVKRFLVEATVTTFVTVCFSSDDEPTVNSKDESTVATSGSQDISRRSNGNLCACSLPPCATRSPSRGRACPALLGSAAMHAEGTASRPPTPKGLAETRHSLQQLDR